MTWVVHPGLLKDKTLVKVRREQLTALLSHLRLLILPSFYLLTLLFLHLLLFLLLPSVAEAVQATEAGTGEGHGLSVATHPRKPAEADREERRGLKRFTFIWQSAETSHCSVKFSPNKSFEHTDIWDQRRNGFSVFDA